MAACDDAAFDDAFAGLALELNNLRAALRWAFTPAGEAVVGVGLAAFSVPLWLSMSLIGEWHRWGERAIQTLEKAALSGTREEMQLQAALGISSLMVMNNATGALSALTRALELSEQLGDLKYIDPEGVEYVQPAKDPDEFLAAIDEELERIESHQVFSIFPETLRIRGELLLLQGESNRALASQCFLRSLDRARSQGALSWELRSAMSLARLERAQSLASEARQLLQSVYGRFTEGFGSLDLIQARELPDELNAPSRT